MQVLARCFAILRQLSVERTELSLADGAAVADAWSALAARYPALEPHREYVRAARNGEYASWEETLAEGDVVAFLPPVSGGSARSGLTHEVIDVVALERQVASVGDGALVTFVGQARDHADDGREVTELEYEA